MTAISKLQNVLDIILKRKGNQKIRPIVINELDTIVMTQKIPIGASLDVSKASDRLKEVNALIDKNPSDEDIGILFDDAVRLLKKAIVESVGKGRGSSPPDSN